MRRHQHVGRPGGDKKRENGANGEKGGDKRNFRSAVLRRRGVGRCHGAFPAGCLRGIRLNRAAMLDINQQLTVVTWHPRIVAAQNCKLNMRVILAIACLAWSASTPAGAEASPS